MKHLLVIRLSAMGDVAMTVPVVAALRKANPELRITVLTRPFFRPFFDGIEALEFAEVDLKSTHKGLKGLWLLARQLKAVGIDAVADMHDVLRSKVIRILLAASGCKTEHIRKGRCAKRRLTRRGQARSKQLETSVERYCDVCRRLGLAMPEPMPFVKTERPLPEVISRQFLKSGLWIGISPFAMHRGKAYPLDSMRRVVELLSEQCGQIFVFGGGQTEKTASEALVAGIPNATSVVGVMSLTDEMNLMSRLDVMLSMDSSAMHIASIVATPVVSIWGATHVYAGFYGFGQPAENVVELPLDCRPCSVYGKKPCRFGDYRCMTQITPQTVAEKVLEIARKNALLKK